MMYVLVHVSHVILISHQYLQSHYCMLIYTHIINEQQTTPEVILVNISFLLHILFYLYHNFIAKQINI